MADIVTEWGYRMAAGRALIDRRAKGEPADVLYLPIRAEFQRDVDFLERSGADLDAIDGGRNYVDSLGMVMDRLAAIGKSGSVGALADDSYWTHVKRQLSKDLPTLKGGLSMLLIGALVVVALAMRR